MHYFFLSIIEDEDVNSPIITLLTDFGLHDGYVASMKGVILGICPDAGLVDISHLIAPQDVRSGAFVLFTTYEYFPPGSIHLVVVDPGVGTERVPICIRTRSFSFIGPDNGIFSLILKKETGWKARKLENPQFRLHPVSNTFHGRDIFAPAAAHLALGARFDLLGPLCDPLIPEWSGPQIEKGRVEGEVIHIDHFGNAITNVSHKMLEKRGPSEKWAISFEKKLIHSIKKAYGLTEPGEALVLAGSSGLIEIAISHGNAASEMGLRRGTKVIFRLSE